MSEFLQFFLVLPLLGFLIALIIPAKKESLIAGVTISIFGIHFIGVAILVLFWANNNFPVLVLKQLVLYKSADVEIFIGFYFDKITTAFALVGSLLAFLVAIFSRFYMHREKGFKNYFVVILFFFLGYNLVIFSGNFETLFIGWEILGICSFLLIAFYKDRYLPVKNGLKVISVYRLADVCLILAMWLSHHLWHENITFLKLNNPALVQDRLLHYETLGLFISFMILLAAVIKSAQLPFSSWLPRAMEGPTTSSAIFYGSLSVHLGAFLLLRTYPFWENQILIKVAIIIIGLATSIVATGIARVQSSVKTQIAYSSAAQIGIIFIEVALGFHLIALIHFAGNAFLRTYQLLVSPSVLNYLIHHQFYNFSPVKLNENKSFFNKISNSLYILCVKEWNLDSFLYQFLWSPFKWVGNKFEFLNRKPAVGVLIALFSLGLYSLTFDEKLPLQVFLPIIFIFLAFILILKAFTEREDALRAWSLISSSQFIIALAIALNKQFGLIEILLYLSGGIIASIVGYVCLTKIKSIDNDLDLNKFHGYAYERPTAAALFLISCLGIVAFPISPSFIGMDLLFYQINLDQIVLVVLTSLCFIFIEIAVLRIYVRIFLGQHKKTYHPIAYRSS